jgi:hypothetical protein
MTFYQDWDRRGRVGWEFGGEHPFDACPVGTRVTRRRLDQWRSLARVSGGARRRVEERVLDAVSRSFRRRVANETPWRMRQHPTGRRHALYALFLAHREREITDGLVDLLIETVHRITSQARHTVVKRIAKEVEKVEGKERILVRIAEAASADPDGTVRDVVFPVASLDVLSAIVREVARSQTVSRQRLNGQLLAVIFRQPRHPADTSVHARPLKESGCSPPRPRQPGGYACDPSLNHTQIRGGSLIAPIRAILASGPAAKDGITMTSWLRLAFLALFLIANPKVLFAQEQCHSTLEKYIGLQYGDVISLYENGCLATLSPTQLTFTAGLAQALLEKCSVPNNSNDLATISTFLSSSMWVGLGQGRDRSNPNLNESLGNAGTSAAAYIAGMGALDLIGGCSNPAASKISAGIVKLLNRTASIPRFVDGCAQYYAGKYSRSQCQCLADVSRAVFPDIHQQTFSPSTIKELIARNPFVGLQVGFQCGIGNY